MVVAARRMAIPATKETTMKALAESIVDYAVEQIVRLCAIPSPTGMAGCVPALCKGFTFLCVRFRSGCSLTIVWHRWKNRIHQPRSSTCRAA